MLAWYKVWLVAQVATLETVTSLAGSNAPGAWQLCAPGVDPDMTEPLDGRVPLEFALIFTGLGEIPQGRLEVEKRKIRSEG